MPTLASLRLAPQSRTRTCYQRHEMLEEAADAEDSAKVIARWKRRAQAWAPVQINMLPPREPDPGFGPGTSLRRTNAGGGKDDTRRAGERA